PGAGGDVAPVIARGGDGGDGAGGVVAAGGDNGNVGGDATFSGDIGAERAQARAAGGDFGEEVGGEAELMEHVGGPGFFARVVHLAGAGDGEFRDFFAGEEIVEEVG